MHKHKVEYLLNLKPDVPFVAIRPGGATLTDVRVDGKSIVPPKGPYDFAHRIIEGPGGMNDFEEHEIVAWHASERVAASAWTIRCLANPDCEHSQYVLDQIIAERARKMAEKNKVSNELSW